MSRANVAVDKHTWIAVLKCLAPTPIRRIVFGKDGDNNDDHHFDFFQMDWFQTLSDPFFLRWMYTFSKTSFFPEQGYADKQQQMLRFTDYAVKDMVQLFEDRNDNMSQAAGYNSRGSLAVSYDYPPKPNMTTSANNLERNKHLEKTDEVLQIEPSLVRQERHPTSAKFEYNVKSASSGRFTKELARRCQSNPEWNVKFLYNTKVQGVIDDKEGDGSEVRRIVKLRTNRGVVQLPRDAHVVVAAGAWTPHILALMDIYAPVYPLKGYAMSISAKEVLRENPNLTDQDLPSRIVADKFMYTSRLGDEIRITSIGEFSGWNTQPSSSVDKKFRREAIRQFPQLKNYVEKATTYCGHRPYVSDGILLLGAMDTHKNLYVSCGPGSNGWKLALGSGDLISRLVSGQTTDEIRKELGFDPSIFSPAGRSVYSPMFAKLCRARWDW